MARDRSRAAYRAATAASQIENEILLLLTSRGGEVADYISSVDIYDTKTKAPMPVARASASAAGRWSLQGQCRCPNGTALS